jgi:hypothetical protein
MHPPNSLNRRWYLMRSTLLALTMLVAWVYPQQPGDSQSGKEPGQLPALTGQSLKQTAIAGGGGASAGGSIRVEATIGQTIVDLSANPPLSLKSGFWQGAIPCPFSLTRTSEFFGLTGGQGTLSITATGGCQWTAVTAAEWIAFVSDTTGTGNGELAFEVRENFTGSAREDTIIIGDYTYTLVQDGGLGADCDFLILPAFQSFPASGGAGAVEVIVEDRCAWEAVASESFITITSNRVGIGNKTVTYLVAGNSGSGRSGLITIGGKVFAVKQKSG